MEKIDANVCFGFWPKRRIDASPEALLRRMDKAGIEKALISPLHGIVNDFKEANDQMVAVCRESSGRFLPAATVNPQTYFGVAEEIDRIVDMGVRLVRFWPAEQEWNIGQKHFIKVMEKIAETPLCVMLPSTESVTAIGNLANVFPNKFILETIRAYPKLAEIIAVTQDAENLFIETHLIASPDFVDVLAQEVGEDRLIFGSGSPFYAIGSSTMPVENADVSPETKEKIFSGNIRRVLGL